MLVAGVDAGSRTLKVVLLEPAGSHVVSAGVRDQGIDQDALAEQLLLELLGQQGMHRKDLGAIVATGYGRRLIQLADVVLTEVTCQAWGVRHGAPNAQTVVDIGGQDSKVLRLKPDGVVNDFVMNDRCAAGSGRFLEVLATRLGVKLSALGALADCSRAAATISSMCVVFAETEIIGLLAGGVTPGGHSGWCAGGGRLTRGGDGRQKPACPDCFYRRRGLGSGHAGRFGRRFGQAGRCRPAASVDLCLGGRHPGVTTMERAALPARLKPRIRAPCRCGC